MQLIKCADDEVGNTSKHQFATLFL